MTTVRPQTSARGPSPEPSSLGKLPTWLLLGLVFLVFAGLGLKIHAPVLHAPAFSDDVKYVVANPWIQDLSASNVAALFDPHSAVTRIMMMYVPVNQLLHALE